MLTVADKPSTASGYEAAFAEIVRRGCLTLITAAHDLREYLVVVGGLAFRNRVENKDAYDLFYVLRNYGNGPVEVAARLRPLTEEAIVRTALEYLREDFAELESPGPNRVALFLNAGEDDNLRAEVVGLVSRFLNEVERPVDG